MKAVSTSGGLRKLKGSTPPPDIHPLRAEAAEFAPAPSLEILARDRLTGLAVGIALLHVVVGLGHLLNPSGWDLQNPLTALHPTPWSRLPAWVLAIGSAFFFFVLRLLLPRLPLRWAHPLGTFSATLVVLNALGWFMLGMTPEKTVPLAFAVFGAGALIFTTRSLLLVISIAAGGWFWFAWQANFGPGWHYFGGVLAAASLLATIFQRLHLQAFKQMLRTVPAARSLLANPQESDEHFRRWYEATFEGIAIHERGVIIEANHSLATLLNCGVESLPGQNLLDWFTRASRSVMEESILLGNFRPFEAVARRPDKTELHVELFTKRITHAGREVMVTAFRDITERQRAVQALNSEQQRLQLQYRRQVSLAKLAAVIGEATEVTRILDCIVETVTQILPAGGGSFVLVEEKSQFALAASFHPQAHPGFDAVTQFARAADWVRDNRETFVASNVMRDDPFEVNQPVSFVSAYIAVPLLDGDKLIGIFVVLEAGEARHFNPDEMEFIGELAGRATMAIAKARLYAELSEANHSLERQSALLQVRNEQLAEAKARAEIASDAKSEFLAKVSHELRTPMNGVIGMTHHLLTTPLTQEQHESAEAVRTSADRLLTHIDRLLDFSRLDAGHFTPAPVEFDIREFTLMLVARVKSACGSKSITVHHSVDNEVPELLCADADALHRALWNLLDNSIRFTERGEIALTVRSAPGSNGQITVEFVVRDTGRGISTVERERLFDPFAQMDNSLSRDHEGLGLGLAITRSLVERMHGTVTVESTPGRGSTFKLSVPAQVVVCETTAAA